MRVAKDIQTDYTQVFPDYVTRNDTVTVLRHYTVRKTVAITLNDVTKFERALSGALESAANHVLNVQFLTADLRKHRDDARARAVQADGTNELLGEAIALGRIGVIASVSVSFELEPL